MSLVSEATSDSRRPDMTTTSTPARSHAWSAFA